MRFVIAVLIAFVVATCFAAIVLGGVGDVVPKDVRSIAKTYLRYSYDPRHPSLWSSSPEVVNAILWDYRCLDTVFETMVLFTALVGCLVLSSKIVEEEKPLTIIARTGVRVAVVFILFASLVLGFRGYVTPGGGFQGGVAFATIPVAILAAYSYRHLEEIGLKLRRAEVLRSVGLLTIAFVALLPFVAVGGYLAQNLAKAWSPSVYSPWIGPLYVAGSILFYNLSELLVVSMEFTAIFILLHLLRGGET